MYQVYLRRPCSQCFYRDCGSIEDKIELDTIGLIPDWITKPPTLFEVSALQATHDALCN
jgi:hypothetical protein